MSCGFGVGGSERLECGTLGSPWTGLNSIPGNSKYGIWERDESGMYEQPTVAPVSYLAALVPLGVQAGESYFLERKHRIIGLLGGCYASSGVSIPPSREASSGHETAKTSYHNSDTRLQPRSHQLIASDSGLDTGRESPLGRRSWCSTTRV